MKAFPTIAALGATALALFAVNAGATTSSAVPTYQVRFADLDLTKPQDTQQLYSRLRNAAREVCTDFADRKSTVMRTRFRECRNQALSDAIETIGNPSLTALHVAKSDMKLAQHDANAVRRS